MQHWEKWPPGAPSINPNLWYLPTPMVSPQALPGKLMASSPHSCQPSTACEMESVPLAHPTWPQTPRAAVFLPSTPPSSHSVLPATHTLLSGCSIHVLGLTPACPGEARVPLPLQNCCEIGSTFINGPDNISNTAFRLCLQVCPRH